MNQIYSNKMTELGYDQLVCDIFTNWESVKDEILIPERKDGSGNGTIHVFLGAADNDLRKEFSSYYQSVGGGADPAVNAVEVKHYFMASNVISMIGYVCKYYYETNKNSLTYNVNDILNIFSTYSVINGMFETKSLFKLSLGASKLRPYFKQFDGNGVFVKLIRKLLLPNSSYKISLYKNNRNEYAAFWLIGFDWLSDFEADSISKHIRPINFTNQHIQRIYFGAPGTGKSKEATKITKETYSDKTMREEHVFRTTFHPDTDYASFVGCYKPKMNDKDIVYEFVPQVFTLAYIKAWSCNEPVYLIIEEINRGNCAQIFGDLFQLLDRKNGVSEYPIKADTDLCQYLENELGADNEGISEGMLKLPANLNILATMNTSDQSLFPMDSAFKRRWEWEYVPIDTYKKDANFSITIGDNTYKWLEFLTKINERIHKATESEDKQMGEFFIKNDLNEKEFKGKVMFYLWSEICKEEYGTANNFFRWQNGTKEFSYSELYSENSSAILGEFMSYLEVKPNHFNIEINSKIYEWLKFLKAINEKIRNTTGKEDKGIKEFFVKKDLNENEFKDTVMLHLWDDVCKDKSGTTENFFRYQNGDKEFSYNDLSSKDGTAILEGFMSYIEVEPE